MDSTAAIKKGWLRVLLFIIGYLLVVFFSRILLVILTAASRANISPEYFFVISITLNFTVSFLSVLLFRKLIDRQTIKSLGLAWKGFAKERTAGLLTGILLLTVMAAILWLMKLLEWFTADVHLTGFFIASFMLLLVSFSEEIVFRGYLLNNLMQSMPKEAALFTSALFFAAFHSLNPNFNLIAFINIFIAGILLGVNYIYSRNLWFAVCFHFSWNFVQGPVLGFEVSGLTLPALLEQNLRGSVLLTGGAFGLEASWLATFALSISSIILYFVFQRKYKSVE